MKIAVTGGTGFIGRYVVEKLLEQDYDVSVLATKQDKKLSSGSKLFAKSKFVKSDILNPKKISSSLNGFDCVVHLAALRSTKDSVEAPLQYNRMNIDGTVNVLEAVRVNRIKKMVFASISSVYGNDFEVPQKEDCCPEPSNPYGLSKLVGEKYCAMYSAAYGIESVSLRPFNVYGPRQKFGDSVISMFIASALSGKKPVIYGDGSNLRDFVYVEDVADAFALALKNISKVKGKAINVGSGKNHSVAQILKMVEKISGTKLSIETKQNFPGNVKETLADISRAKNLLGWEPKYSLEQGLRKTFAWYKANL